MSITTRDIQARLAARGFDPGPIDNIYGGQTRRAMEAFMARHGKPIRSDFHPSGLHRIVLHWPVSGKGASASDLEHYHAVITHDMRVVLGWLKPEANADTRDGQYVAHTRGLNAGSIGIAIDGMVGAQERPFDPGPAPFTRAMLDLLAETVADMCLTYDIPVSRWTVLSHAEVQPTLGVWQRGKWDIAWIPGMTAPGDPVAVGDVIRDMVRAAMPEARAA